MLVALAAALGAETGRALRASSWTPSPLRSRPKHIDDVGGGVGGRLVFGCVLLGDDLVGQPGWMAAQVQARLSVLEGRRWVILWKVTFSI